MRTLALVVGKLRSDIEDYMTGEKKTSCNKSCYSLYCIVWTHI